MEGVYFGHLMRSAGKDPDAGKDSWQVKGKAEGEMVGWHHRLNGHESEQAPGDSEGQGSLVCCSSWGCRVDLDLATEQQPPFFSTYFCTRHNIKH